MQRISMQIEFRQKIPSAIETEETTRECTLGCGPQHNAINAYLHTGVARSLFEKTHTEREAYFRFYWKWATSKLIGVLVLIVVHIREDVSRALIVTCQELICGSLLSLWFSAGGPTFLSWTRYRDPNFIHNPQMFSTKSKMLVHFLSCLVNHDWIELCVLQSKHLNNI